MAVIFEEGKWKEVDTGKKRSSHMKIDDTNLKIHGPNKLEKLLVGIGVPKKQYRKLVDETDKELVGKSGAKEALRNANISNIKIVEMELPKHLGGFYRKDGKTIVVNKDMSEGEKFWAATHELEHLKHKDHLRDARKLLLSEPKREFSTKIRVKQWLKKNIPVGVAM